MKRTVLAATVSTALAAAAIASSPIGSPSTARQEDKATAPAWAGAPDLGPAKAPPATVVADSGRPPVPLVRKPGAATSSGDAAASAGRGASPPDDPAGVAPTSTPPAHATAVPLADGDDMPAGRSAADAVPPPGYGVPPPAYPVPAPGYPLPAPWPAERIVITRGSPGDYVVIPVDRHVVVIRGWRGGKPWKHDKARRND